MFCPMFEDRLFTLLKEFAPKIKNWGISSLFLNFHLVSIHVLKISVLLSFT